MLDHKNDVNPSQHTVSPYGSGEGKDFLGKDDNAALLEIPKVNVDNVDDVSSEHSDRHRSHSKSANSFIEKTKYGVADPDEADADI